MKNIIIKLHKTMYLPLFIILLLILALCVNTPKEIIFGYYSILISPSILITDYLEVSNLGATLFNVATIMLFNMYVIRRFNLRFSGPIYSGLMIIAGFSFFGKNIFNTLPIYFGIFLYSKIKKTPFKNYIMTVLFSTGISPLVSYCFFGLGLPLYFSIPLGLICGITAGLIVPSFASHTIRFHNGYNLYNTGFALGVISVFFNAIFTSFGLEVNTAYSINNNYHYYLLGIIAFISLFSIIVALITDWHCLKRYLLLMKRSGRLVSDFIRDFRQDTVLLNVGIIGIICIIFLLIFKIEINGPVIGTILSIMGIGAYGLHPRNMLPILIGAIVGIFAKGANINDESIILAILFSTGLAPIAGRYGIIIGIISGFLHVMVAPLMISFQGGFDLYNNGFAAGFVASVVVVVADALGKGDDVV